MFCKLTSVVILLTCASLGFAQKFDVPLTTCSQKKVSYLTLDDGTQLEGQMKDLGFKKGLIDKMKFEPVDGKKVKLKPASIKHMYLPPSGFEKLTKAMDLAFDVEAWNSRDIDGETISKGYVYYEKTDVMIGKKKTTLMMQLLNTSFADGIRIYNDPFAKETASVGIGDLELAGGDAKSYYIKKGNNTAYRLYKKHYLEEFYKVFSDCPSLLKVPGGGRWENIESHVHTYSTECAK